MTLRKKRSKISRHSENHMGKESKQKNVQNGAAAFFKSVIINSMKTFVIVFNWMTTALLAEICQGDWTTNGERQTEDLLKNEVIFDYFTLFFMQFIRLLVWCHDNLHLVLNTLRTGHDKSRDLNPMRLRGPTCKLFPNTTSGVATASQAMIKS